MAGLAVGGLVLTSLVGPAPILPHPTSVLRTTVHLTPTPLAPSWAKLSARPSPPASSGAMMAYDVADGYVLVLVGNESWKYLGGTWTQLHPKISPPTRSGMMAYDPKDKNVVLFGGIGTGCGSANNWFCNDTWTFAAGQWTNVTSSTNPGLLASGSMAYDPQVGRVLQFGGYYDPCGCVDWISNSLSYFDNGNWTIPHAKGANSTLPGEAVSIAYDAKDRYLVEFGGFIYSSTGATTWNYSHRQWTEINTSRSPSFRELDSLVFDPKLGCLVLFGGVAGAGHSTVVNDTWKFVGGNWTKLHPAQSPLTGLGPAVAYDTADGYLLLFGGRSSWNGSDTNETWVFS